MNLGHRHQSLRRRGLIKTAAKVKSLIYSVDTLVYTASSLSLFFTLDQMRIIWIEHNATGVSPVSWIFYSISALAWLCYGLTHKERVLIIMNSLWFVFSLTIMVGVIIYR